MATVSLDTAIFINQNSSVVLIFISLFMDGNLLEATNYNKWDWETEGSLILAQKLGIS